MHIFHKLVSHPALVIIKRNILWAGKLLGALSLASLKVIAVSVLILAITICLIALVHAMQDNLDSKLERR